MTFTTPPQSAPECERAQERFRRVNQVTWSVPLWNLRHRHILSLFVDAFLHAVLQNFSTVIYAMGHSGTCSSARWCTV